MYLSLLMNAAKSDDTNIEVSAGSQINQTTDTVAGVSYWGLSPALPQEYDVRDVLLGM